MANNVNTNPVYLDTWGSDVTIVDEGRPATVYAVVYNGGAANDKFQLEDVNGNVVISLQCSTNSASTIFVPPKPIHCAGLVLDVSDGVYTATAGAATALIYL